MSYSPSSSFLFILIYLILYPFLSSLSFFRFLSYFPSLLSLNTHTHTLSYSSLLHNTQNTMHPYISLTTEYVTVSVPEAIEYTITFDTLTKTELFQDTVTFCSDTSCTVIYGQKAGYSGLTGTSWPGVDGTNQLVISASSFVVRFTTNGTYGIM